MEYNIKGKKIRVDEIISKVKKSEEDIIFLAGSLIEGKINEKSKGMGNEFSDIDVFIITKEIDKFQGVYNTKNHIVDFNLTELKTSIDIEYFDFNFITTAISELNNIDFNSKKKIWNYLPYTSEEQEFIFSFLHRLLNSIVINNEEGYKSLLKMVNFNNYYKFYIRASINEVEVFYEDIVGNLNTRNYLTAVQIARNVSLVSLRALVFYSEESLDRDKWIWLKCENLANENLDIKNLVDEHKRLQFESTLLTENDFERNIKSLIKVVNKTINYIGRREGL